VPKACEGDGGGFGLDHRAVPAAALGRPGGRGGLRPLEIQRIAEPDELAGIIGVYYSLAYLAYLGFLLPAVLAALARYFSYPAMLAALGVLATASAVRCAFGWSKHLPPRTQPQLA